MRKLCVGLALLLSAIILYACSESTGGGSETKGNEEEQPTYSVDVTVAPEEAGSISPVGKGSYEKGEEVQIGAVAKDGYLFESWMGDVESTDNPLSLTVDKSYAITANFKAKTYDLSITTVGGGTVREQVLEEKSKDYENGIVVELTATPSEGYRFVEWKGDVTGTDNPARVTVDEPKSVTAVFEEKSYELSVHTEGNGAVSEEIVKTKEYAHGTVVELAATPAEGWEFVEWKGNLTSSAAEVNEAKRTLRGGSVKGGPSAGDPTLKRSTNTTSTHSDNPFQITVDSPREVTAVFKKMSYSLTVRTNGKGTVAKNPDQQEYKYKDNVSLEATPAEGYRFARWEGGVSYSENPATLTVSSSEEVTAVFIKQEYELTTRTEGEGTVNEEIIGDENGTNVQLSANPADGWTFVKWRGDLTGSENPAEVLLDESKEVTAVFEKKKYGVKATTHGEGNVSKSPSQSDYEYGSTMELTAEPAVGWKFTGWAGDVTGMQNPVSIDVDENKAVQATFEEKAYDLTVNTTGKGAVQEAIVDGKAKNYGEGTTVRLMAYPGDGWEFIRWEGALSSTTNPEQVVVDQPKEVTAVFAIKSHQVVVSSSGEGTVSKSPDQTDYEYGTSVELSATPTEGWKFAGWQDDLSGMQNPATLSADEDKNVQALFEKESYALKTTTSGEGSIAKSPTQSEYEYGSTVGISATPAEGWKFVEWTGTVSSTETTVQITMNQAKSLQAAFEKKSYEIATNAMGEGSVNKDPQQSSYKYGSSVNLSAKAAEGYEFVEWQGDITDEQNPVSVTVDNSKEVTAVFEEKAYDLTVNTTGEGAVREKVVQVKGKRYTEGTTVELTAFSDENWEFVRWEGGVTSSDNPAQIVVDQSKEVTAVFERKSYPVAVSTSGGGEVTKNPEQAEYDHGSSVELSIAPATGWKFISWQGDVTGSESPAKLSIDGPKDVQAVFEKRTYPLKTNTAGEGAITKNPSQSEYEYGSTVDISANPAEGWKFVEWQGAATGSENPTQVTIDEAKDVTAVFEKKSFPVSVSTTGEGTVTKEPNQEDYTYGSSINLTAEAAEGYYFVEWQGDVSGVQNPLSVTIDQAKEITAVFEAEIFGLDVKTSGQGQVTINPQQTEYEVGSTVEITANASGDWAFDRWSGDVNGTNNPITVTMDADKSITAEFRNTAFAGGAGTEADPYQVATVEQLQAVGDYTDAHYVQINDIDADATANWNGGNGLEPIGDFNSRFNGSFDGNNFKIRNLTIIRPDVNYIGIFGYTENAIISNITLDNLTVEGNMETGAIIGKASKTSFSNIAVSGSVKGKAVTGGAIGSTINSEVINASFRGTVEGEDNTGGLIGVNDDGIVNDSYSSGSVDGRNNIGGLIGRNVFSNVVRSYSSGTVSGVEYTGGFIGVNDSGNITESYSVSSVSGTEYTAGFAGYHSGGLIKDSYSTGNVVSSSPYYAGGFIGWIDTSGKVRSSFSVGEISGSSESGGFIGRNSSDYKYDNYWDVNTSGKIHGVYDGSASGVTGLSTDQMTGTVAETNIPAFDWSNIWKTSDGYPILSWE